MPDNGTSGATGAAFLRTLECADSYDAKRPLRPWLVGILVRVARVAMRRGPRGVPAGVMRSPVDPADEAEQRELAEQLDAALRGRITVCGQ